MKNHKFKDLIVVTCLMWMANCQAEVLFGRVVGVADGDTLTLLDANKQQHKIRVAGIDAPEKKQPFGNRSKEALSDCAYDKDARVETDKADRYGRKVGRVWVGTVDCNLRQIELGMAWHYKEYEREQTPADRVLYDQAEQRARAARRGIWSEADPVPPWVFRKAQRGG